MTKTEIQLLQQVFGFKAGGATKLPGVQIAGEGSRLHKAAQKLERHGLVTIKPFSTSGTVKIAAATAI